MKDFEPFTKIALNVGDLGKIIVATGALRSCPKRHKLPNLVTLQPANMFAKADSHIDL